MKRWLEALSLPREGLALFRRLLGGLCAVDAALRLTQATFLYSDLGTLPRSSYYALYDSSYAWSLYLLSGQPAVVAALLLLVVALGLAQMAGRDRRAGRLALWLLVAGVQGRHPWVNDAADDLLRLLLFWDLFLPETVSGETDLEPDVVSLGTLALQLQLTLAVLGDAYRNAGESWLLAAQWGERPQAAPFFWLPLAGCLALPVLWFRPARRRVGPLVGLLLLARAGLMHPAFPVTLLAGLSCVASLRPRAARCAVVGALAAPGRHKPAMLLACLLGVCGPTWILWGSASALAPIATAIGLRQDWSRVYPLAEKRRVEVLLRAPGYPAPLFGLDLDSGRRLRLLSNAVASDLRLSEPLANHFSRTLPSPLPVSPWIKLDLLSKDGVLGERGVRQLEPVTARPLGQIKEDNSL